MTDEAQKLLSIKRKFASMRRAEKKIADEKIIAEIIADAEEKARQRKQLSKLDIN